MLMNFPNAYPGARAGIEPGAMRSTLLACLLVLLLAFALSACARQPGPENPEAAASGESQDGGARPEALPRPLPRVPAGPDDTVHVRVRGGTDDFNKDTASLIMATLQSEIGLYEADGPKDADIIVDVDVKDIYVAAVGGTKINAGRALTNTALATTLGIAIGSIAGHREGALVGAGIGAAVGLGVTVIDSDKDYTWAMRANVHVRRKGETVEPVPYEATADGTGMDRPDAEFALKNRLSEDIAKSLGR